MEPRGRPTAAGLLPCHNNVGHCCPAALPRKGRHGRDWQPRSRRRKQMRGEAACQGSGRGPPRLLAGIWVANPYHFYDATPRRAGHHPDSRKVTPQLRRTAHSAPSHTPHLLGQEWEHPHPRAPPSRAPAARVKPELPAAGRVEVFERLLAQRRIPERPGRPHPTAACSQFCPHLRAAESQPQSPGAEKGTGPALPLPGSAARASHLTALGFRLHIYKMRMSRTLPHACLGRVNDEECGGHAGQEG